jgi:phosphoribosylpyrophosphate synthetase
VSVQGQAVPGYKQAMQMVLKSNNPVILSYAADVLTQAGIESVIFDTHASIMDGSIAVVPRRLMVLDEDHARAEILLRAAVPEAMP